MGKTNYISDSKETVHLNLARLKKGGENFEVPVNSEEAIRFKEGADIDVREVVNAPHIFFDAQKGEQASETRMESLFGTTDPFEVAKIILKEKGINYLDGAGNIYLKLKNLLIQIEGNKNPSPSSIIKLSNDGQVKVIRE